MKNIMFLSLGVLGVLLLLDKKQKKKFKDIQLSKNFKLSEFLKTSRPVNNTPHSPDVIRNIQWMVTNVLQPLRDHFKKPVIITSGYRSKELNNMLEHSAKNSEHLHGRAVDIKIKGVGNQTLIDAIQRLRLPVDKVIDERLWYKDGDLHSHLHITARKDRKRNIYMLARNTPNNLNVQYINV